MESASRRQKSIETLPAFGSHSVNECLIPENYTFNRSLSCEEQQLHNTWPLLSAPDTVRSPLETMLQRQLLTPYLYPCSFGDRYLPHTVEAIQVRLREARGQDGSFAFSQISTTWH